jgi:hypothetical protein
MSSEQQSNLRTGNRLFWRAVAIIGLVLMGVGLSGMVSEWIVAIGIEWISVTNVGMFVVGVWVIISAAIAEVLTDRVFKHIPKNE